MNRRGMGSVYKRGSIWWAQYWWRGKQHCESSNSTVQKDAIKLLRQRYGEMGKGKFQGHDMERTTFEDLVRIVEQDYRINGLRSIDRMRRALAPLRDFFGSSLAHDITLDRLKDYIEKRQGDPVPNRPDVRLAAASIKYELAILRRGFRLAQKAGKAICPPFPTIRLHNTRQGFFERPQFEAVRRHLSGPLQAVITFAYLTGWRMFDEILSLQWRQVDFHAAIVRLEPNTTKNEEARTFPFRVLPELADLLQQQRERTTAMELATGTIIPWVFHREGKPIKDFRKAWENACKAAGVPGRIPHDFRRTAVRNLERAGVPRSVAKKLTGHKTDSVYNRYAIVSETDLSEGVGKLAALHSSDSQRPDCSGSVVVLSGREGDYRTKRQASKTRN